MTISSTGLVTDAHEGASTISASLGGVSGSTLLTVGPPISVTIGNGPTLPDGTYYNAQELADNLVFTSLVVEATNSVTVVDPSDLSTSSFGTPRFNLSLVAPTVTLNKSLNLAAEGNSSSPRSR